MFELCNELPPVEVVEGVACRHPVGEDSMERSTRNLVQVMVWVSAEHSVAGFQEVAPHQLTLSHCIWRRNQRTERKLVDLCTGLKKSPCD